MFVTNQIYALDTIAPTVLGARLLPRGNDFFNLKCLAPDVAYEIALTISPTLDDVNNAVYELRHDLPYVKAKDQTYVIFSLSTGEKIVMAHDWIDKNSVADNSNPVYVTATWTMPNEENIVEIQQFFRLLGYEIEINVARG